MDLVDWFYRQGKVLEIEYQDKGIRLKVNIPKHLSYNILKNQEIKKIN
jgi:hypothetical protein